MNLVERNMFSQIPSYKQAIISMFHASIGNMNDHLMFMLNVEDFCNIIPILRKHKSTKLLLKLPHSLVKNYE